MGFYDKRAIITRPESLILDEPINGLNSIGFKEIRNPLKMLLMRKYFKKRVNYII
ncbi:MAG: ABC-type molybdenum transport system ATPase subunit/photorepair protein PhrA [Clostridium sp.]|jgi:ABC-type molybdenum transport system ATPase subunit/photorepair protein PhrA